MIGNGFAFGTRGYVIVEEGEINPLTLELDVLHYRVVKPSGETESGCFTLAEAQALIQNAESKLLKNE